MKTNKENLSDTTIYTFNDFIAENKTKTLLEPFVMRVIHGTHKVFIYKEDLQGFDENIKWYESQPKEDLAKYMGMWIKIDKKKIVAYSLEYMDINPYFPIRSVSIKVGSEDESPPESQNN